MEQRTGPKGHDRQPRTDGVADLPAGRTLAGEPVNFVSTSSDADGTVVSQLWDLDSDGAFDDASGTLVSRTFAPGTHTVRLRIVDSDGAEAIVSQAVPVAAPAAQFLNPFPVVRLIGGRRGR